MSPTRTHRHGYGRQSAGQSRGTPMYYGWSHDDSRMQMMDLPDYVESFRLGYERALDDLQGQLASVTQAWMPMGMPAPAGYPDPMTGPYGRREPRRGPGRERGRGHEHGHDHDRHDHDFHDHDCGCGDHDHHHDHGWHHDHDCGCGDHDHDHDHRHDHDCGCGHHHDCRCECCIVDADYVVYARCGELRRVPIVIENDTRKVREDVTLEVSDVRSSGGRTLPWQVAVLPEGPIDLPACSSTTIDLVTRIVCERSDPQDGKDPNDNPKAATAKKASARAKQTATAIFEERELGSVDDCTVGYVTIRVGGCVVRPIVVAIAVLPSECGAYHAGCSCSCCC